MSGNGKRDVVWADVRIPLTSPLTPILPRTATQLLLELT